MIVALGTNGPSYSTAFDRYRDGSVDSKNG